MSSPFLLFRRKSVVSKIYGVSWNKGSSPTLTRTDAAVGFTAAAGVDTTPATNDFDTAEIFKDITEVTDGYGNVFVRIPKFYIEKTDGVNSKTWRISKTSFSAACYLPKCFGSDGYAYIGKYNASLSGASKLESKPVTAPLINVNIVQMRGYAQANGAGYQQLDIHAVDMLQTLFTVEFATLNSQAIMAGWTNGNYSASHVATVAESGVNRIIVANATAAAFAVNQTISIGASVGSVSVCYGRTINAISTYDASNKSIIFDGATVTIAIGNVVWNSGWISGWSTGIAAKSGSPVSNSDGKHPMMYRGIENFYGSIWQFVDGLNIDNNQAWVCADQASYASNLFAAPYEQVGYVNGATNGYPTAMGWDAAHPYCALPSAAGGSASTYYSDYYYQAAGKLIAFVGGYWSAATRAGAWYWYLSYASGGALIIIGGRLLRKTL